jgi:glycine oxidase
MGGIIVETDDYCLASGDLADLAAYSRSILPDWVDDISRRSGVDVPILATGDLQIALSESDQAHIEDVYVPQWRKHGFDVRPLTRRELEDKEPLLTRAAVAGYLLPAELALEPRRLMAALTALLETDANVRVRLDSEVTGIEADSTEATVTLRDGTVLRVGKVVVAAGYLSGDVVPEIRETIFPVRGQAFEVYRPGHQTYPLNHHCLAIIDDDGTEIIAYAVPRSDGRMSFGVTYETQVADPYTTEKGQSLIERGLGLLIPAATTWPITRRWAGVRPGIANGTPLIGPVRKGEQLIIATGHYGLGVTLAPVTAELVSALVNDDENLTTPQHLATCDPGRLQLADRAALERVG